MLLYKAILKAYFKNKIVGFLNSVKVGLYVIKNSGLLPHWGISILPASLSSSISFFNAAVYRAVKHRKQTFLSLAVHDLASLPITYSSGSESSLDFLAVRQGSSYKLARALIVVASSYGFSSLAD